MTPETDWSSINSDHAGETSSFVVYEEEDLEEGFNWKNIQLLLKKDNLQKSKNLNLLKYRLQFINVY